LSGAQFLASTATLTVNGSPVVTCQEIPTAQAESLALGHSTWYGLNVETLLEQLPPAMGVNDPTGYSSSYDQLYS